MYINRNPTPEPMYNGSRPNSSLNEAVTRGTTPKPRAYTLRPIEAWKFVALRSRVMVLNPMLYADAVVAGKQIVSD